MGLRKERNAKRIRFEAEGTLKKPTIMLQRSKKLITRSAFSLTLCLFLAGSLSACGGGSSKDSKDSSEKKEQKDGKKKSDKKDEKGDKKSEHPKGDKSEKGSEHPK